MKSWSMRAGKYFGIDVFIHWTFWILIIWIVLMHVGNGHNLSQALSGVLFIFALFLCVVLHEFGHALVARRFGVLTHDITLYPIGGVASLESMPEKPAQELLVGLAGPAVNLTIALFLWAYLSFSGQLQGLSMINMSHDMAQIPILVNLFYANIVLALFNLIPAFPMDGGRVFRGFLSFFMDRIRATRIAAGLGQFLAIVFVFLGFFYNFWLVFIGLFIYLGASGEAVYEQTKSSLKGLTIKDALMRRFSVIRPNESLKRAVDLLLNSQETEFVIADGDRAVGLLTKDQIIKGLAEAGVDAQVSAYMSKDYLVVRPDSKLSDFYRQVDEKGKSLALVMDDEGFLGLIDSQNIEEKLLVQQALADRS